MKPASSLFPFASAARPLFLFPFLLSLQLSAQTVPQTAYALPADAPTWMEKMYEAAETGDISEETLEQVRQAFEEYHKEHELVKTAHTQFYKRWVRNVDLSQHHLRSSSRSRSSSRAERAPRLAGHWNEMGPWHYDPEVAMYFQVQSPGACHVYTVEQAAADHEVVWAGTATAGAWKSVDHGAHWALMTRDLPVGSVYSVEIDQANSDRVWIGEGNGHLWRTEDGGETWSQCGSSNYQNVTKWYRDLRQQPGNPEVLIAATNEGLWRSADGGDDFTFVESGEFMEIEFHPTNPDLVYVVKLTGNSTVFKISVDGGQTYMSAGEGWPTLPSLDYAQKRCEIAVSLAAPDRVAVLASGSTPDGSGLYGIFLSEDAGATFAQACCGAGYGGPWTAEENPNILGWSEDGTGDGGQFYYDLALGMSPTDADRQFAAGINVWRTEDGGGSWSLNGHWVTWAGEFTAERYTHADVHDVKFFTRADGTVDLWVASDGGLHYSADQGDHFEPRMYGMHGTDFWGWQAGWRAADVMVGGTYHNGTLIRNGDMYHFGTDSDTAGGWLAELAGDNFRGFVNPADATRGYHDGGAFDFSEDRWTRISGAAFDGSKKPNTSYVIGEYGNLEWDPRCSNCMYSPVGSSLWYSEDGGVSWMELHDFGGDKIISVKVSPRHPERIYVSHKNSGSSWRIHRSDDGGLTWENVSMSVVENGNNGGRPIYLEVDGEDADRVWAVLTGNQTGHKVFQSLDAGETWQDLTTAAIEGERCISIAHQRGSEGGLYVGTLGAVYYRDDAAAEWTVVGTGGLPARTTNLFLQPDYCGGTIRSAGNRGVHEVNFVAPSAVRSGFMADRLHVNLASPCETPPVRFAEVAVARCGDLQLDWTFEGGVPATAEGPEVDVFFGATGTFDVTLTVTDADGTTDSWTWADMIEVVDEPVLPSGGFAEDFDGEQFPPANWRMETPGHAWEHAWDLQDETNGVAQFPNYWVDTQGAADLLITPGFDPAGIEQVSFDVTYQTYADYVDGLALWGRPAGAADWTELWAAEGADLAVAGCYTWFWYDTGGEPASAAVEVPMPAEWTSGAVSCLELAWANIGGYGNHIWVDNVAVGQANSTSVLPTTPRWALRSNPNSDAAIHLVMYGFSEGRRSVALTNMAGERVWFGHVDFAGGEAVLDVQGLPAGLYLLGSPGLPALKYVRLAR